jgi:hypothetical protein
MLLNLNYQKLSEIKLGGEEEEEAHNKMGQINCG